MGVDCLGGKVEEVMIRLDPITIPTLYHQPIPRQHQNALEWGIGGDGSVPNLEMGARF